MGTELERTDDASTARSGFAWYAIRVRTRFELIAATALRNKEYDHLLPLYRSRRAWSDRTKELDIPLFPGYVFAYFDAAEPLPILIIPGVMYIVGSGTRPLPIENDEIAALISMCQTGLPLRPWPFLSAGQRVTISRGPLAGIAGFIVSFKSAYRLVVSVSILQRSVAAEVDREWIEPVTGTGVSNSLAALAVR